MESPESSAVVDVRSDSPIDGAKVFSESTPQNESMICTKDDSKNLYAFPDVSQSVLSRNFVVELPNIEITSLDVTANGCFILAGCSNGMVVLFDMTSKDKNGTLAGQIRAKGMHTNLIVTVKFSEDCRYGFAGVIKGSMEMLAVDVGQIQVWHDSALRSREASLVSKSKRTSITDANGLRHKTNAARLVRTFSHLDPKLRGFGAVSCLSQDSDSSKYVLVCGKGIKNVHVWTFTPPRMSATAPFQPVSDPVWSCLYDVATNGVTIESLGFRHMLRADGASKLEMLSKSSGMGIRVWDLSNMETDSSSNKIPYEDIANSNDCKAFCEEGTLSFGGTYEFSVMRLDAPKWANRESYEVPTRCNEDDNGERRRRLMRQIEQVLATQDGSHALALCTDGGVLYYRASADDIPKTSPPTSTSTSTSEQNTEVSSATPQEASGGDSKSSAEVTSSDSGSDMENTKSTAKSDSFRFGQLVEFQTLTREVEFGPQFMTDNAWCLKRVGQRGVVVLVRACQGVGGADDEPRGAVLDVSVLSDLVPGEVRDTSVPEGVQWHTWKYYHDGSATVGWDAPKPSVEMESISDDGDAPSVRTNKHTSTRGRPPSGKTSKPPRSAVSTSTPRGEKTKSGESGVSSTVSSTKKRGFSTPVVSGSGEGSGLVAERDRRVEYISPHDNALPPRVPKGGAGTSASQKMGTPLSRETSVDSEVSTGLSGVSKRLYSSATKDFGTRKKNRRGSFTASESDESETEQVLVQPPAPILPLVIPPPGPPPLVKKIVFSDSMQTRPASDPILVAVETALLKWCTDTNLGATTLVEKENCKKGAHVKAHEVVMIAEQQQLFEQFLNEILRGVRAAVAAYLEKPSHSRAKKDVVNICRGVVSSSSQRYKVAERDVVHRQTMELRGERAKDLMVLTDSASIMSTQLEPWKFFYPGMYETATMCIHEIESSLSL